MGKETEGMLIGRFERDDIRRPAHEMDEMRQQTLAYEYLCHLEEAKLWLEALLGEDLPPTTELEDNLRNGVHLAKLGHFIAPHILPLNKIYDPDQKRFKSAGLQFRHTDNIHQWLKVLKTLELPITFQPETTDVYDKKNMPRVIYCVHALSTHLFKLGRAPLIQNLYGKVNFTEDEIDIMKKRLQQYGIVMPSFQKIGGLLSSNLNEDDVVLHAAVININKTLDNDDDLSVALLNRDANLKYICMDLIDMYKDTLTKAKRDKVKNAQSRSLNESYTPDVYDELLTQVEIQGHIVNTNYKYAWLKLSEYVESNDTKAVCETLNAEWLNLKNVNDKNVFFYIDSIILHLNDRRKVSDWPKLFHDIIKKGNKCADSNRLHQSAIDAVNAALDSDNLQDLYKALNDPNLDVGISVDEFALPLIYEEMTLDRTECEKDLNHNEISSCLRVLLAVASVSKCVDYGDSSSLWIALNAKELHAQNIHAHCKERYISTLTTARNVKRLDKSVCSLLTYLDIQDCIDMVNSQDDNNDQLIEMLNEINKAVNEKDSQQLIHLLRNIKLHKDITICDEDVDLYMRLLRLCLKNKDGSELWLEDIENIVYQIDSEVKQVKRLRTTLIDLNLALLRMDTDGLMNALLDGNLGISKNDIDRKDYYYQTFQESFMRRNRKYICPWVVCHTDSGSTFYIDVESCNHAWTTPRDFVPHSRYLSKKDVVSILKRINRQRAEFEKKEVIMRVIVGLQAYARGFVVRRCVQRRHLLFKENIRAIVTIQSWWRSCVVQKKYRSTIKLNTTKALLDRLKTKDPWSWYKLNESKIVKIQALWRGKCARHRFLSLVDPRNPSFKVVQMFIPILDFRTDDYDKELELQNIKSQVVQTIRKNQELANQIESMDVKIGLLVQNRITLQDVVAHGLKLNKLIDVSTNKELNKPDEAPWSTLGKGLKALTKDSRKLLDGYQHLFYVLQTNPVYLSRLLFCLSLSKTNQMLQRVILTLYNFGANPRDEYLLINFFKTSLEEEINLRITSPFEIVTSPPIVLKMAVNYSRTGHGPTFIKEIICPLVSKILRDDTLVLETNPIDIFKAWRNQLEMQSGKISSLPFNVTTERALSYPEVRLRLESNLELLKRTVTIFLDKITATKNSLPFCITYMARVLQRTLSSKFPSTPAKDILKVVGHLVYYLFLNSVIVAPDLFDLVQLNPDRALSTVQRKNLATVAKLLHFSASKKGFGDESSHLKCLNQFIIDHHESMKDYFRKCCEGPSLEEHFSVNEYTEATLVQPPHIFIKIQEIVDTHRLLLEHQEMIAPDPQDKLLDLLDDIGNVPSVSDLTGKGNCEQAEADVCLTLIDKPGSSSSDASGINKLFIKTKELSVSLMPYIRGDHFLEALCIGTTEEQQKRYALQFESKVFSGTIKPGEPTNLREHIAILRKHIVQLEDEGFVTREDGYQAIITSIALDLRNMAKYRQAQKKALQTLKRTKQSLDEKTKFYQDQSVYYDRYIKKCLENLTTGKKNIHADKTKSMKLKHKVKSKLTVKYSALKLYEKGVILEIDGLSVPQFKNVQFEITPLDNIGIFCVKGKFMGVEVEKIQINVQDLLQMQYDGCAIMDMFGKAKVNVNLLLFLLNSKFYGKA